MSDLWSYCPSCTDWVHWILTSGSHGRTGSPRCPACGYAPQAHGAAAPPASRSPGAHGEPVLAIRAVA